MALEKHSDQDAQLSATDPNIVVFAMIEGGRVIHVEIPVDVMHAEFGATKLGPVDFFESHRAVIEGTAKQIYERLSEPSDRVRIGAADFAAPGSRANAADEVT
ncbi:DUF1488 family protein [Methylobacterium sp. E-016]|uniref:DUF1488 family protein n=1 Tax=Methylobacterium sp. E-016 TaxID=2836556 RepID=UPI001FB9F3AF|nr:DUF1488 family protein [Methylobacterium sp. E-016]MCJ2076716.1 DUF1488 family protein [Methylobacterium sp. E-016]